MLAALRALGYRARLLVSDEGYFQVLEKRSDDVQAVWSGWVSDCPSSASWIGEQFSCGSHPFFCDSRVDRAIRRATALQASDPSAANAAWTALDRLIMDRAPFVPLLTGQLPYFVAERVGNYQYHPVHELLLDQLWVR